MKKNKQIFLVSIIFIIFSALEPIIKIKMNYDFNMVNYLLKEIILFFILIANFKYFFNQKKIFYSIKWLVLILMGISCISNSFNLIGYLFIYFFLIIIALNIMIKKHYRFDISLVISVSLLIIFFIILGLLNLLKFSFFFIILIIIFSFINFIKNKESLKKEIKNLDSMSLIIFSSMLVIAVLSGIGRYVHSWDEYSYWAYAAKVLINEDSLYSLIANLGITNNYPPVSSMWHYIINIFVGFSEPNLYIGLTILTMIYFLPVLSNLKTKNIFTIIVSTISVIFFSYMFNGAYFYTLLYVDLLLAAMCSSILIFKDNYDYGNIDKIYLILLLIMVTLLKVNGFVFAFTFILLFYLKDIFKSKITIKNILNTSKKYIFPVILVILIFGIWLIITKLNIIPNKAYMANILPDILKTDLSGKLNSTFILNFFNSLINSFDENIIFSFVNISLFGYLIITMVILYYGEKDKDNSIFKIILPYIISYLIFFLVTALSLFVMFSNYEASKLASFGRYLNPINISFMLYGLYIVFKKLDDKKINIICLIIISLIGFGNVTGFVTDIKARRNTVHISEGRNEIFSAINNNTSKDSKVFIINQEDVDSIMPLWYARYYTYPRIVNSNSNAITWKIKTDSNTWDLQDWGLTSNSLAKHLLDYNFDYVFFYTNTEELKEELKDYFTEDIDITSDKLFKINSINGKVYLQKVNIK